VKADAELMAWAGIDAVAAKAGALTAYAIELHDELLAPLASSSELPGSWSSRRTGRSTPPSRG
jgi:hypothetical protein